MVLSKSIPEVPFRRSSVKGITKSGTGWRIIARVWVSGKIVERSQVVQGTKEQAKAARERLKEITRTGRTPSCSLTITTPKTFKDILNLYRVKSEHAPFSAEHEKKVKRLEDMLGASDAIQLADRLELTIGSLRCAGKNHQANRYIQMARAAFEVCVRLEHFIKNPITELRFPLFKETARDNYLTAEEVANIIAVSASNPRTSHITEILRYYFSVPCRKSEVLRMKIADVDIFSMRIRVHNGTTKNDEGVWKPIPPAMQKWFVERKRDAKSADEPVFCRIVKGTREERKNGALQRIAPIGDFKNAWDTVREKAGHPTLRIHDSRHISATDMINAGTPRTVVMSVANWKTDMLRTYYHLASDAAIEFIKWPEKTPKHEGSMKAAEEKAS